MVLTVGRRFPIPEPYCAVEMAAIVGLLMMGRDEDH
jgi:hypothetical protein